MAEKLDPKELVTIEELTISNADFESLRTESADPMLFILFSSYYHKTIALQDGFSETMRVLSIQ